MADQNDEKAKAAEQAALFGELEKNDVKVADDAAEKMKENILNDKGGQNYLGIGVHEVQVTSVELTKAKTGTLGIRFNVENADGRSDATMWLSEAALPYTIENVSRLFVHNAPDDKKADARQHMANINSAKALFDTVTEALKARAKLKKPFMVYLSIAEDKSGRTYTDKNGEEKPSLTRNLLSYRPKETPVQTVAKTLPGAEPATNIDLSELPF